MNAVLTDHTREIANLCRKYEVLRLEAFGSVVRNDFDPTSSDVDLIAAFSSPRESGYADRNPWKPCSDTKWNREIDFEF